MGFRGHLRFDYGKGRERGFWLLTGVLKLALLLWNSIPLDTQWLTSYIWSSDISHTLGWAGLTAGFVFHIHLPLI